MIEHEKWMQIALLEAKKALNLNEVPIGAIIIKDGYIIGKGYNQCETLNDPTAHAEIIAITSAANTLKDWRLEDCSLYVTKEPCLMCFGAKANSRIERIYYGSIDEEKGFVKIKKQTDYLTPHLNYVEGKILESDCKKIIQDFFKKKR